MKIWGRIKRWVINNWKVFIIAVCLFSASSLLICVIDGVKGGGLWENALDILVNALISFLGFSVTGYIFLSNMLQSRKSLNNIEAQVINSYQIQKRKILMKYIVFITVCVLMRFCLKYLTVNDTLLRHDLLDVIKYLIYIICTFFSIYSIICLGCFLFSMINYEKGLHDLAEQKRKEYAETKSQEPVSKGKFLNQVNNIDIVVNRLIQNHTYAQTTYLFDSALKSALCDGINDQGEICACGEFADNYGELIEYRNLLIQDNSIQDGENVSYGATAQKLLNQLFKEHVKNEILTNISLSNLILREANLSFSSLANSALYSIEFQGCSNLEKTDFRDSTLNGIIFNNSNCKNSNFRNSKLINVRFDYETELQRTIFDDADLTGLKKFGTSDKFGKELTVTYAKFRNTLLSSLDIFNIDFTYADFENAQFVDCKIGESTIKRKNVVFAFSNLAYTNFLRALIVRSSFENAKLIGADLTYAKIEDVAFDEAHLEKAGLIETRIAYSSFIKAYGADLSLKGSIVENTKFNYATLTNADMSGIIICNSDFSDCVCRNILAVGMKVSNVKFVGAVFNGSRIVGEEKQNVEFYNCDFTNVDFSDCAISNIVFKECDFNASDFSQSRLINVNFYDCNNIDTIVTKNVWINGGNVGSILENDDSWRHC